MAGFLMRFIERLLLRRSEVWGLRVVATTAVTPHMLRVTFESRALEKFATDENLHVRLVLPAAGQPHADWLKVGRDGRATRRDGSVDPVYRKYTIRSIDPSAGRLAIDFVLHGDGGPGASWAADARPGDVVGMIGPGGRGMRAADWHLIAGDETALPAIGRLLESLPDTARGTVIVEVQDAAERQALRVPSGMTLHWLHRGAAAPGTTDLLADAVRAVELPGEGSRFVWVAAEEGAIRKVRRHLRAAHALEKGEHLIVAYWRREVPSA